MSRGTEQNLDDFLKSLREAAEEVSADAEVGGRRGRAERISDEDLQSRLKNLYGGEGSAESDGQEASYVIDEDFLREARLAEERVASDTEARRENETDGEVEEIEDDEAFEASEALEAAEADTEFQETDEVEELERTEGFDASDEDTETAEELEDNTEAPEDTEALEDTEELEDGEETAETAEDEASDAVAVFEEDEENLSEERLAEEDFSDILLTEEDFRDALQEENSPSEDEADTLAEEFTEELLTDPFTDEEWEGEEYEDLSDDDEFEDELEDEFGEESPETEDLTEEESDTEASWETDEDDTVGTWVESDTEELSDETEDTALTEEEPSEEQDVDREMPPVRIGEDIIHDSSEEIADEEDVPTQEEKDAFEAELDDPTLDLMLQLGCDDELEKNLGEEEIRERIAAQYEDDIPLDMRTYQRDGREASEGSAHSQTRIANIRAGYHRRQTRMRWRITGTVLVTLLLMLYELLPLFGVKYGGILDYRRYPSAYVLIGLQLFILCLACSGREIWRSVKKTFLLKPDRYSTAVLAAIGILGYDLLVLLSVPVEKPFVFHFAGAFVLLISVLAEGILSHRERKSFEIFFTEHQRYTLSALSEKDPLGAQLRRAETGEARIYMPDGVTEPRGFFRTMTEKDDHRIYYAGFSAFVLSALFGVICICVGAEATLAFRLSLMAMLGMLPLSAVFQLAFVLGFSASRLARRDCALGGSESIYRIAEGRTILLRDLHLFEACTAKQAGIVFLREEQTEATLAGLHALYSAIGGPMESVFKDLPEEMRAKSIRIHRIAKNGIEALVDDRNVLLVGDDVFMGWYGVTFEKKDVSMYRNSSVLYVSLNGLATARISVRYTVLPAFEMLVDRLAKEGIRCVVETYDPLINSKMVAKLRGSTLVPVSVLHKNASDFNRCDRKRLVDNEPTGVVAGISRLKLVEAMVWCRRIRRVNRVQLALSAVFSTVSLLLAVLFTALLGVTGGMNRLNGLNQLSLVLYLLALLLISAFVSFRLLPGKRYFFTEEYLSELEAERDRCRRRSEKREERKHKNV